MNPEVVFHRLVQRDMNGIRRYYTEEVSEEVADRFYECFIVLVEKALAQPIRYHPVHGSLRGLNISGFSYH